MAKSFEFSSVLSYNASFSISPGFFYAVTKEKVADKEVEVETPVSVTEQSVRGVMANYGARKEAKNLGRPNLQVVDRAFLPQGCNTCRVKFSLTVLPNAMRPNVCNEQETLTKLSRLATAYADKRGMQFLAGLYLQNIISATWLWRNKTLANQITVRVEDKDSKLLEEFYVKRNDDGSTDIKADEGQKQKLIDSIAEALAGRKVRALLDISATFATGDGNEVFPSQEMPRKNETRMADGYDKSKILACIETNGIKQAVFHSQKIGNALRTIDQWYPGYQAGFALAVEPFGVNAALQEAFRKDKKSDFYSVLENNYDEYMQALEGVQDVTELPESLHNCHFAIACLIRGGVYSK